MAYIGRQLARGTNKLFDDISSSFNGSTTTFNLTVASVATSTATPYQLFVSLGGVMQKPGTDFTTAGNQITFTTAPAAGISCWIMMQGDSIDQAAIPDGVVTASKIANSGDFAFPADIRLKDSDGSHYVGFEAPATVSANKVWTLPAADGSANQYLKTNGSGVLSWGSDSTSDPSKMPLAGGSFTGDVTLNAQKDLRFADSDSSNWVAFQAPATISSNVTWTLPAADGSANQLLTTNGSGTLSWSSVSGGATSIDSDNNLYTAESGNSGGGYNNVSLGYQAGDSLASGGNYNVFLGREAGRYVTTGDYNVGIGANCLKWSGTNNYNVAIGMEVLKSANYLSQSNVGIGKQALGNYNTVSGSDNVAVGSSSLYKLTSGSHNVSIGNMCLYNMTTPSNNVAVGTEAGKSTTTGSECVFIGYQAAQGGGTAHVGQAHTAVGYRALGSVNGDIWYNTAIGHKALEDCDTGNWNTAVGATALTDLTGGRENTAVGRAAGNYVTTGDNNLLLGTNAGTGVSPSGSITTGDNVVCLGNNSITALYCADTSISSSDSRDKTDVTNFTHGLNWVNQLNPITYRWDKRSWYDDNTPDGSKKRNKKHIGFLAQDVLTIEGNPTDKDDMLVVNLNEDDTAYGLKYERLVPVLVNAIKELAEKNTTLETRLTALESA